MDIDKKVDGDRESRYSLVVMGRMADDSRHGGRDPGVTPPGAIYEAAVLFSKRRESR